MKKKNRIGREWHVNIPTVQQNSGLLLVANFQAGELVWKAMSGNLSQHL